MGNIYSGSSVEGYIEAIFVLFSLFFGVIFSLCRFTYRAKYPQLRVTMRPYLFSFCFFGVGSPIVQNFVSCSVMQCNN